MHRALLITEIQLVIVDKLVENATVEDGLSWSQEADLLALALTCKAIFPAAMKSLWRRIPSLTLLIKTFPADLWEIQSPDSSSNSESEENEEETLASDSEGGSSGDSSYSGSTRSSGTRRSRRLRLSSTGLSRSTRRGRHLSFNRDLTKKDWERYDTYAVHVRELGSPSRNSSLDYRRLEVSPSPSVFAQMSRWRPSYSWIPNLESATLVQLKSSSYNKQPGVHLINSSLKELRLKIQKTHPLWLPHSRADAEVELASIPRALDSVIWIASNIRMLHIGCFAEEFHAEYLITVLEARRITGLELFGEAAKDKDLLHAIAKTRLDRLGLTMTTSSLQRWRFVAKSTGLLFPDLKTLKLEVRNLGILAGFVAILRKPALRSLDVTYQDNAAVLDANNFVDAVNALQAHCSISNLTTFALRYREPKRRSSRRNNHRRAPPPPVAAMPPPIALNLPFNTVLPADFNIAKSALFELVESSAIKDLTLDRAPLALSNNITAKLLVALPEALQEVQILRLIGHDTKKLDLKSVAQLSARMPQLEMLEISGVDVSRVPRAYKPPKDKGKRKSDDFSNTGTIPPNGSNRVPGMSSKARGKLPASSNHPKNSPISGSSSSSQPHPFLPPLKDLRLRRIPKNEIEDSDALVTYLSRTFPRLENIEPSAGKETAHFLNPPAAKWQEVRLRVVNRECLRKSERVRQRNPLPPPPLPMGILGIGLPPPPPPGPGLQAPPVMGGGRLSRMAAPPPTSRQIPSGIVPLPGVAPTRAQQRAAADWLRHHGLLGSAPTSGYRSVVPPMPSGAHPIDSGRNRTNPREEPTPPSGSVPPPAPFPGMTGELGSVGLTWEAIQRMIAGGAEDSFNPELFEYASNNIPETVDEENDEENNGGNVTSEEDDDSDEDANIIHGHDGVLKAEEESESA